MYSDILQWAKETNQRVKVLAWGYGNAYNKKGEFVGKTKEPNWIRLVSEEMSWLEKAAVKLKWRWAALKRHVAKQKGLIKGIKKWWALHQRCKECNKFLLKEAERAKRMGPAEPPTAEDVQDFIKEMGGNIDANCVERMPPTKRRNIDRDI
jgi:hypothetical protein